MSEKNFFEGAASNNFGVDYSFGGKKLILKINTIFTAHRLII